ncbi:FliH/SctL family protein [Selenihalanaerobacter shriftii]|uniref:Flagellar assembly protein FliH n=1 Tax=Selenihalanaerobacter shriftii TaxID=142842 RepID=A0A1T4MAW4_9FIRM|nr:FliH/SctL family protein [Selenihalanaerobacter shriftii]SJZ64092.1 flagellar assembly protein FliH [Selenihalanaerobacter shriftii]
MSNVIKSFQVNQKKTVELFNKDKEIKQEDNNQKNSNDISEQRERSKQKTDKVSKIKSKILTEAKVEAEKIITNAQQESEQIKESARQEAEEIKEEAYQTGLAQGKSEIKDKGWQEVETVIDRLNQSITGLNQDYEEKLAELNNEVLELTIAIVKKIIKQELKSDQTVIYSLIEDALQLLNGEDEVVVRVNLRDLDVVRGYKERFLDLNSNLNNIKFIMDDEIEIGGCIVEADFGGLDATVTSQLEKIADKLLEVNKNE